MNTKQVGNVSEAACLAKFIELGWEVLVPFGDNSRWDFVIVRPGVESFERVQVKTARLKDGVVSGSCQSSYQHRGRKAKNYKGQVDWIAFYCIENRKIYMFRPEDVGSSSVKLRCDPAKNNQVSGTRKAEQYEIERLMHP